MTSAVVRVSVVAAALRSRLPAAGAGRGLLHLAARAAARVCARGA